MRVVLPPNSCIPHPGENWHRKIGDIIHEIALKNVDRNTGEVRAVCRLQTRQEPTMGDPNDARSEPTSGKRVHNANLRRRQSPLGSLTQQVAFPEFYEATEKKI